MNGPTHWKHVKSCQAYQGRSVGFPQWSACYLITYLMSKCSLIRYVTLLSFNVLMITQFNTFLVKHILELIGFGVPCHCTFRYHTLWQMRLETQWGYSTPGGTPILRHGREVPRWWPPFWGFPIRLGPYFIPLSEEKIGLSLSHLVPEILGPKFGLIFHQNVLFNRF